MINARSPFDALVHLATPVGYTAAGEPTVILLCIDELTYTVCKLARRRYETDESVVTCITCLVLGGES